MGRRVGKEFIFIDESGDPGIHGASLYLLIAIHVDERGLDEIRRHLAAFRYHHDVVREFKAQRWADKPSPPTIHLLESLARLTSSGRIATTCTWLDKDTYRQGRGPYLSIRGETQRFRAFQLRLLLERHRPRNRWGENLDVVIDRWRMNIDQRRDLEDYLRGNLNLRPVISSITAVDSAYVDPIQVADVYSRIARRVVEGSATDVELSLCHRLMWMEEIRGGIYA